jgi:quercetin dioxygenase-like cupin family protein
VPSTQHSIEFELLFMETVMAITHAKPGQVINVRPLGTALASALTHTLIRTTEVEVIRLIVASGKEIPEHKAKGDIVVQCLEGAVAFTFSGKTENLRSGDLLFLDSGEPHSVKGIEGSSILLTVLLPKKHGVMTRES